MMDLRDAFRLTGASIRTHKLRSLLAAVGVVLGIGSVIGIVTMGAGFQESVLGTFTTGFDAAAIGIAVQPTDPQARNDPQPGSATVSVFTDGDVDALRDLPHVRAASARGPLTGASLALGDAPLEGIRTDAQRGAPTSALDAGRAPQGSTEALASNGTALRLMTALGRSDILGTSLTLRYPSGDRFETTTVTLVGVEKATPFAREETVTVDASYATTTLVGGTPTRSWRTVALLAEDVEKVPAIAAGAASYLDLESDARGRLGDRWTFRVDTQESVTGLISSAITQFTVFIGAIGAVALLVGLVGIANIMLVSVSERTREIGVMKATGATRRDIILVFLVESVAICLAGAILGIGLGMLMGLGLDTLVSTMSGGDTRVPFVFVPDWYVLAVFLGVFVGLTAGLYPAWRAARVSPVEALRYE